MGQAIKKLSLLLLAFIGCCAPRTAIAQDYAIGVIGPFGGLNNTDNPLVIPANKAQDLLNVEVTPGGRSVKKRKGYGLQSTLTITTSPVHGIYNFYDANGNSVSLYFNDSYLSASINGATPTVLFSTGPNGATYQCVDSQGFAYCNNTSRTTLTKANGTTATSITTVNSTGTLVAVTPERLATAGFAEAPSRIDFSKANDFATWTVGGNATDPVQFTIVSPGSRLTHIVYAFGRVMWFKDSSFGYILTGDSLGDWQIRTVSPTLGTLDNTSVYWEGILYFRGQDGHIYAFDGSNYQKLTRDISGTISTSLSRTFGSWTQTTQSDWEAGAFFPSTGNFTIDGSISLRGWSESETTSAEFAGGTFSDTVFVDTETVTGNLQTVFPDLFTSYRTGASSTKYVWKEVVDSRATSHFGVSSGLLSIFSKDSGDLDCGSSDFCDSFLRTINPNYIGGLSSPTTYFLTINQLGNTAGTGFTPPNQNIIALNTAAFSATTGLEFDLLDNNTSNAFFYIALVSSSAGKGGVGYVARKNYGTTSITTLFTGTGKFPNQLFSTPFTLTLVISTAAYQVSINSTLILSSTHGWTASTNTLYGYMAFDQTWGWSDAWKIDDFTISPQTFTYTSPSFDTSISSPTWGNFTAVSAGTGTITYTTQVSSNGSSFDSAVSATSGSPIASAQKRYIKLNASFNHAPTTFPGNPLSLSEFTLVSLATGTFYSQVKNASSLTYWDSFIGNKTDNGGSHTFYMRSSTNPFTVTSSTPTWTAVTLGGIPAISTGTYFQIRDDMVSVSSSALPSLQDFTVQWFEGTASDKTYATYFKDALWWEVTAGTGSTVNNRILRYDFLNSDWYVYDIANNGMLVRNNSLYFGSATGGYIYKFGDVDSDNGSAINAYWKSKDFFGENPFVDKEFVNLSVAAAVNSSSATVTYTLNGTSATAYSINLYDSAKSFIRNNRSLRQGTIGNTFNVKFGNNAADQPFELFAIQYGVRSKSWVPGQ